MGIRSFAACVAAVLLVAPACNPTTRYHALSLIFDGVPPPAPETPLANQVASTTEGSSTAAVRFREHGPYGAKLCPACHESTSANTFVVPKEQLCAHCHEFKIDKKFVHGPIVSSGCTSCHDPHSSVYPKLLVAAPETFCYRCHDKEEIAASPAHKETTKGCTDCHDPHQSDNDHLLRSPG